MPRFERLVPEHAVQTFASGKNDLDTWLHDAAETADRAGTARVYLWLDDENSVVGYFAILPHSIRRGDVPKIVGRGAPETIPGFLLARLALAEHLHGVGHGGELLVAAIETILTPSASAAAASSWSTRSMIWRRRSTSILASGGFRRTTTDSS